MDSVFLSNVELYYVPKEEHKSETLMLQGDECSHIVRVMRHSVLDEIYVTDGAGHIFRCQITGISKSFVSAVKLDSITYTNDFSNIFFCMPKLKSPDRFEFAIEKCVELGITNFVIYNAEKSVAKGEKTERWQKIMISAMKQSLRSYLPEVQCIKSIKELTALDGQMVTFDQEAKEKFADFKNNLNINYYFIFGPEGGFSERENIWMHDSIKYSLAPNRLRAETAVISAASVLAIK